MVDNPDFTPSQVGGLFTFLARQLAKPDNTLFVNRKLFDQVPSDVLRICFIISDVFLMLQDVEMGMDLSWPVVVDNACKFGLHVSLYGVFPKFSVIR